MNLESGFEDMILPKIVSDINRISEVEDAYLDDPPIDIVDIDIEDQANEETLSSDSMTEVKSLGNKVADKLNDLAANFLVEENLKIHVKVD